MTEYGLTYFLYGGGQDSTYILLKIINDPAFRAKHVKGRLLVAMADTGAEHEHTYKHVEYIQNLCWRNEIEFMFIRNTDGHHGRTWPTLTDQYRSNRSIGSAAFRQTCSDNLKVRPCDNFLEAWIIRNYGYDGKKKKAIYQFTQEHGRIQMIIGFAKGEEKRSSNGSKFDAVWKQRNVDRSYPLLIEGIDRQACIDYNEIHINHPVFPSNCDICMYQSDQEVLWLWRFYPKRFREWRALEQAKIDKHAANGVLAEKNYGVYGKLNLAQKLAKAHQRYGHMSDQELNEYKYSHGHCIKTKY